MPLVLLCWTIRLRRVRTPSSPAGRGVTDCTRVRERKKKRREREKQKEIEKMRESDPVVLLEIHSPFLTAGASTRQITCNKVSSPNRSLQFPNSPPLQSLSLKGQLRDDLTSKNCAVKPPFESQTISIASLPPSCSDALCFFPSMPRHA